jgi:RNA polymerase sigma-70 factor (ECF subfamily)
MGTVMRSRIRFKTVALPHLTAIYRLACQLAGRDRADDLTQETFLRAWVHFDQFEPGTNCRAWLCRILRNTWVNQWRKTRLELPVAAIEDVPSEPAYDWERHRFENDLSEDMQWALEQLPEPYRWAVLLADVEEFSYQEIADTMACPLGTVMSRISRGRRMLGQLLSERRSAARSMPLRVAVRERG